MGADDRPPLETSAGPAAVLAEALQRHGSDISFGVPGGGPNLDVVGALNERGIRFVLAHSETSACIMASVYGLLTGRVAATVVTRGPGAAAAVNGAAQATLDRHPLVLVTDTVPTASSGRVPHQRIDQRALFAPVCKRSITLGATTSVDALTELIDEAAAQPRGALHLDYDTTTPGWPDEPSPGADPTSTMPASTVPGSNDLASSDSVSHSGPDDEALARAETLLGRSTRPVVIIGLAAPADGPEVERLRALLEQLGAPVLTTYQAIGTVDTEHRLAAGLFTNGASERALLDQADLIVTIGLDVVEPIPAPWSYQAPVLSLSPYPTPDPYLPIDIELVGDPVELAERLIGPANQRSVIGWESDAGSRYRDQVRAELAARGALADDPGTLGPLEVVQIAADAAPDDITTTVDAGAHFLAIMPFWPVSDPRRLLISNGLATMGYAVPAAVAAGLAAPDRPVLCLVGDGGLGMTLAELETIARLDLPVTVVVFNDSSLSLIRIKQQPQHGGADAVSYRSTDFATLAGSLGLDATVATTPDELTKALDGDWDRPRLIDARIDPEPYAHLIKVTRG